MRMLFAVFFSCVAGFLGGWILLDNDRRIDNANDVDFLMQQLSQVKIDLENKKKDFLVCDQMLNKTRFDLMVSGSMDELAGKSVVQITKEQKDSGGDTGDSVQVEENILFTKNVFESLNQKIEDAPEDQVWQSEVSGALLTAVAELSDVKQEAIKCVQFACRVEISSGDANNADEIIDRINAMQAIQGERIVQFNESNDRAVVYFGRDGAVSLLGGVGF